MLEDMKDASLGSDDDNTNDAEDRDDSVAMRNTCRLVPVLLCSQKCNGKSDRSNTKVETCQNKPPSHLIKEPTHTQSGLPTCFTISQTILL